MLGISDFGFQTFKPACEYQIEIVDRYVSCPQKI